MKKTWAHCIAIIRSTNYLVRIERKKERERVRRKIVEQKIWRSDRSRNKVGELAYELPLAVISFALFRPSPFCTKGWKTRVKIDSDKRTTVLALSLPNSLYLFLSLLSFISKLLESKNLNIRSSTNVMSFSHRRIYQAIWPPYHPFSR